MSKTGGVAGVSALRTYGPDRRFMGVYYMLNTKALGSSINPIDSPPRVWLMVWKISASSELLPLFKHFYRTDVPLHTPHDFLPPSSVLPLAWSTLVRIPGKSSKQLTYKLCALAIGAKFGELGTQFRQECSHLVSLVHEALMTTSGTLYAVSAACPTFRVVIQHLHKAARPAYELGSAVIAALPQRFSTQSGPGVGAVTPGLSTPALLLFAGKSPWPADRRRHAAYAATQIPFRSNWSILGFREDAHWWGTSVQERAIYAAPLPTAQPGSAIHAPFRQRSGVHACTLLVELLLGEYTSHAIASHGHDSLKRSGPHALLPRPPQITHIYPCTRTPSLSGSPSSLMGALCVAAGLAHYRTIPNKPPAQRLSTSMLNSVPPPVYGDGETPEAQAHFSASDAPRW
ncbi:hypothetical protein DFH08DRAFT_821840 [Mycena albidolilacea]|uniref:Uncharacterized protein n=1 Tax=Mycena albidolilacea TaxID=1033008 RepID=A0AAD7EDN1_9AGAR|nr:hypothetical protein DFH08DRAFT_821840 [Mycena albidolilacea]